MVLGDVQAVDAGVVGRRGEVEALVEQCRERALAVLDMVEKSNFHGSQLPGLLPRLTAAAPHLRGACPPHPP